MSELEKLLEEYEAKFGEGMPLFMAHFTEKELLKTLRNCLETNKPYELPADVKEILSNPKVQV